MRKRVRAKVIVPSLRILRHPGPGMPVANLLFIGFLVLYLILSLSFFLSPLPGENDTHIYLLSRDGEVMFEYSDPDRGIRSSAGPLPDTFIPILLLAEDRNYFSHPGVDPLAILRATWQNLHAGRIVSGGSTIAQQYVRIHYPQKLPSSALLRKPVEALYALKTSARKGREELLQEFIETAPLGANRRGFYSAARHYFGKDLWLLNCEQQATLVILLRRTSMSQEALQFRLRRLMKESLKNAPELAMDCGWSAAMLEDQESEDRLGQSNPESRPGAATQEAGNSPQQDPVDSSEKANHPGKEPGDGEAVETAFSGYPHSAPHLGVYLFHSKGIRGPVHTELDQGLQTHIQSIMQSELKAIEDRGANQAAVIVLERSDAGQGYSSEWSSQRGPGKDGADHENTSGEGTSYFHGTPDNSSSDSRSVWLLRAMIGSSDFSRGDGQVNGALSVNDAGSVLKPFLYALAIEELDMRPGTLMEDTELVLSDSIRRETYSPRNHDLRYSGVITLREALAGSRNIPAIRIIDRLGTERFYRLLKDAGFEHMQQPAREYGPSLALGTGGATLFEVTLLFGALAAEGQMLPVRISSYPEIEFGQNKTLFRKDTALLIRHILSDVEARRGSFGPRSFLDFPFDVAAKTGTSKDFRDSWAVGYTNRYVVGVWTGNFRSEPTLGISGARGSGRILHQVLRMLHENSDTSFSYPQRWRYANICKRTGYLAGPECPHWTEPFLPEDVLPPPCNGNHEIREKTGILHPLQDQIFVLDPHRPLASQEVLIEIRARADCSYSLNDRTSSLPENGHLRQFLFPESGNYELQLRCPGQPPETRMFRIQK